MCIWIPTKTGLQAQALTITAAIGCSAPTFFRTADSPGASAAQRTLTETDLEPKWSKRELSPNSLETF